MQMEDTDKLPKGKEKKTIAESIKKAEESVEAMKVARKNMLKYNSSFAQNIVREILEEVLPYMNIYRDEQTTGIHAGWDITGTDTGATAMTDVVNEETPVEEGLDVPDTTDTLPGNEEEAEGTDTPQDSGDTPQDNGDEPQDSGDTPQDNGDIPQDSGDIPQDNGQQ